LLPVRESDSGPVQSYRQSQPSSLLTPDECKDEEPLHFLSMLPDTWRGSKVKFFITGRLEPRSFWVPPRITDGQILEAGLFSRGVRPTINVGLSVSCVGSACQDVRFTSSVDLFVSLTIRCLQQNHEEVRCYPEALPLPNTVSLRFADSF